MSSIDTVKFQKGKIITASDLNAMADALRSKLGKNNGKTPQPFIINVQLTGYKDGSGGDSRVGYEWREIYRVPNDESYQDIKNRGSHVGDNLAYDWAQSDTLPDADFGDADHPVYAIILKTYNMAGDPDHLIIQTNQRPEGVSTRGQYAEDVNKMVADNEEGWGPLCAQQPIENP